jgi:hypothetical protein
MSDATKFTPGPWTSELSGLSYSIEAPSFGSVAKVFGSNDRCKANANLIAAAPRLYAALAEAAACFRRYESLHRAKLTSEGNLKADNNADMAEYCEAALAKARGQS